VICGAAVATLFRQRRAAAPRLLYCSPGKHALRGRRCAALLCPGRCVGAHGVIVAAIARCGVARAPIADCLREGKCRGKCGGDWFRPRATTTHRAARASTCSASACSETMSSGNRINKIATSLWTGVSPSSTAADVAAPILDGVKVIVSASHAVYPARPRTDRRALGTACCA
jgi:hypothetical protein